MAQVLKESQRVRILTAAKKELLEKGVRDASMRSIAFHSGMTAGNLYRYFKGKDELIQYIVAPALQDLNEVIQRKTQDRISLFQNASSLGFSKQEMVQILDSLADDLTLIYEKHQDEMQILFLDSEVQAQISEWFTQLIQTLIEESYSEFVKYKAQIHLFSRMMSASVFSGLQECFRHFDESGCDSAQIKRMVRLYFRLYLSMLDADASVFSTGG